MDSHGLFGVVVQPDFKAEDVAPHQAVAATNVIETLG